MRVRSLHGKTNQKVKAKAKTARKAVVPRQGEAKARKAARAKAKADRRLQNDPVSAAFGIKEHARRVRTANSIPPQTAGITRNLKDARGESCAFLSTHTDRRSRQQSQAQRLKPRQREKKKIQRRLDHPVKELLAEPSPQPKRRLHMLLRYLSKRRPKSEG